MRMLPKPTQLPGLSPGCLVMWQDNLDKFNFSLVIQIFDDKDHGCYSLKVIKNQCIIDVTMLKEDEGKRWRILRAST